jgi:hypothetical protein
VCGVLWWVVGVVFWGVSVVWFVVLGGLGFVVVVVFWVLLWVVGLCFGVGCWCGVGFVLLVVGGVCVVLCCLFVWWGVGLLCVGVCGRGV